MPIDAALSRSAWWACAVLGLASGLARAETSPWFLGLSQTQTRDANVLRLAEGQDTPDGYSRADTIRTTALLAGLDQSFGRQRAYGTLNLRNSRYVGNPRFDNTNYSAQLGLDWATVGRVSGSVNAFAARNLQNFSANVFTPELAKDLETTRSVGGRVTVGLVTAFSLEASGSHREVRNSLTDSAVQARDFDQDTASLGLRWRPSAVGSVGLVLGATQGRYPRFATDAAGFYTADRFKRQDVQLNLSYAPSSASVLEARLANGRTTYDLNQRRNFSGLTGSLSWNWQATGKLRLVLTAGRDTGQDSYAATSALRTASTADYSRVNTAARMQLEYLATGKLAFGLVVNQERRDLVRTIDDPFIPESASGADRTTLSTLSARWAFTRNAMLGCERSNERRVGEGQLTSSMRTRSTTCFAQLTLQ